VVGLVRDLGLPVKLVGVGEKIGDLQDFDPPTFVDALLGYDEASSKALQQRLQTTLSAAARQRDALAVNGDAEVAAAAISADTDFVDPPDMDGEEKAGARGKTNKKKKKKKKK